MFKSFIKYLYKKTTDLNEKNILSQLEFNQSAKYLDLGCNDGKITLRRAKVIQTRNIYGIEIVRTQAIKAIKSGISVKIGDLNNRWDYPSNFFDVITANQVIEHVSDIDHFISELRRVLKRGGYAIISTENGSSWHNIFASIMGWQIFSSTNISVIKLGIGNPIALFKNKKLLYSTWTHKTIFNYQGLKEILELYGFFVQSIHGSGYHPFPPQLGNIDIRHSHYLTVKFLKL